MKFDKKVDEDFKAYAALLELQERLKTAKKALEKDAYLYANTPEGILEQTQQIGRQIDLLLGIVKEAATLTKTVPITDRGYNPADRGLQGWSGKECCGSGDCSSCGSGGSSGCGVSTP